jgi:hypothetical protein
MTPHSIILFQKHGLITNVMGTIPFPDIRTALVIWARKEPKYHFRALIAIAQELTKHEVNIYVDDVCSQIITGRSRDEQEILNNKFVDFFCKQGCVVKLSSAIYETKWGTELFNSVLNLGRKISVAEFLRCLPEAKRTKLDKLHLGEVLHTLFELLLFEQVSIESNLLVVGQFSQAIVASHRNISSNPLSAIVIPKLNNCDEVDKYIASVKKLRE